LQKDPESNIDSDVNFRIFSFLIVKLFKNLIGI